MMRPVVYKFELNDARDVRPRVECRTPKSSIELASLQRRDANTDIIRMAPVSGYTQPPRPHTHYTTTPT